jgi:hypothetical protein
MIIPGHGLIMLAGDYLPGNGMGSGICGKRGMGIGILGS